MKTLVIMPGGFHPFHAGHASLYKDAVKAFPGADVYVTASNDTSERSFPFAIKEKLARVAGVPAGHFVQVTSPFSSEEITSRYDPDDTILIFVKSEKNSKNGSDPEGPFPAEVDPATGKLPLVKRGKRKGLPVSDTLKYYAGNEKNLQPMSRNRYIAYLPTVPFGPGIKSGSEFRSLWDKFTKVLLNPKSTPEQKEKAQTLKTEFVKNMYPATQGNDRLAVNVVKLIDKGMSSPLTNKSDLAEGSLNEFVPPSSDRGDGGEDNRSRRIRKLLEIAIQVAKEKNVDELGMIHAMNMIAGDEFFNTAVEGILPDITDKEYMFVLQSAYKTVKQGLAEGWFDNVKNKIKDSISDEKIIPMNINDLLIKVKNNDLNDMSGDSMAVNNIVRWAERTQNSEIIELMDSVKMYLDTFDNAPQWASWTGKKNTDINKLRELVGLLTQLKLKAAEYFSKKQGLTEGSLEEVDRRGFLKGAGAAAVAGAGINAINNSPLNKKLYTVFGDGKYIAQVEATSEKEAEQQIENNPKYKTTQYKVVSAHVADPYGSGGTQKWSAPKQTKSIRNVSVGDTESNVYSKAGSPNKKSVNAASNKEAWWYSDGVIWMKPGGSGNQMTVWDIDYSKNESVNQDIVEGDVVPFKQPSKALTWKQVPKDVLLLANDWLWAEYDNTGLDAVMDPKGFGNGTANELQYITAKLQQKGWTIDHNDENDGPGEFNLRLTNNRGQTVLLSIEDAQTFTGWAKGTSQYDLEEAEKTARVFHPQYVDVYFLDGPRRTPILVNKKVPYNLIDRYLEVAIKKYNLQQGRFEFRNAEEDPVKVTESVDYLEEK